MTRVIAHRGASHAFAEQTRAAYLQAIADGSDGVECDVRLSADGAVICIHDPSVDRTSDGTGMVHELTLAQMRALDMTTWHGVSVPAEYGTVNDQLLTLGELIEVLHTAHRPISLAIELKQPNPFGTGLEDAVIATLTDAGWSPQTSTIGNVRVDFMSFDPRSMLHLVPVTGRDPLVVLTEDIALDDITEDAALASGTTPQLAALLSMALAAGRDLIDAHQIPTVSPGIDFVRAHTAQVRSWIEAGTTVRVWTVDEREDVDYLVALGVQEITTNRPHAVLEWLGR